MPDPFQNVWVMRGPLWLRKQFVERYSPARMIGISLRLARWVRIYILPYASRKQNKVAPNAFIRYDELCD
jgi:hypothetical protein